MLIAHYKLNDNAASSTVVDATGVHNGNYKDVGGNINTSTGDTANSRGVGTCLDFDGDEYVEITDHVDFTPILTPFSISAWVYMHDSSGFWIVSKGIYNTDAEYAFDVHTTIGFRFVMRDESVDSCEIGRKYTGDMSVYENVWTHLVGTYSGSDQSSDLKLYINGERVDDGDEDHSPELFEEVENLNGPVWIGRYSGSYTDGLIDNVMIFNQELNLDEIKALYNGGHGTEIVEVIDLDRRIQRRQ